MTYHSIDGAVRPNLDCVLLKRLVNVVEDGLHTAVNLAYWFGPIITNQNLKVLFIPF